MPLEDDDRPEAATAGPTRPSDATAPADGVPDPATDPPAPVSRRPRRLRDLDGAVLAPVPGLARRAPRGRADRPARADGRSTSWPSGCRATGSRRRSTLPSSTRCCSSGPSAARSRVAPAAPSSPTSTGPRRRHEPARRRRGTQVSLRHLAGGPVTAASGPGSAAGADVAVIEVAEPDRLRRPLELGKRPAAATRCGWSASPPRSRSRPPARSQIAAARSCWTCRPTRARRARPSSTATTGSSRRSSPARPTEAASRPPSTPWPTRYARRPPPRRAGVRRAPGLHVDVRCGRSSGQYASGGPWGTHDSGWTPSRKSSPSRPVRNRNRTGSKPS